MNREDIKKRMDELNAKLRELGEKTKDNIDTAKIKGLYAKDKMDAMIADAKSNAVAMKENFNLFSSKTKSKVSSEVIKAQMNIENAKKELAAKKDAHDKASLENYIEDVSDYAFACSELAMLATEEAKLAALEAISAQQEYDEKYGKEE